MTVQANLPPTNTNSDGVTATFNYDFKVTREEHLTAMYTVIATGETGDLEIDSVTGVGNDGGGTVTFATAPADGMIVTVDSIAPLSQIEAFTGNKLPPPTVERGLDAIAIQNQRQQGSINRSLRFHPTDSNTPTLPPAVLRQNKLIGFNAAGTDFEMIPGADDIKVYRDEAVQAATDATDAWDNINANLTAINAVVANETNINTVAGIDSDVTTVAGISADVTAVAGNETNINAVVANETNINTVAGNIANVNALGAISADVTSVAGISDDVQTVAGVADEFGDLANIATAAAGSATSAAASEADAEAHRNAIIAFGVTVQEDITERIAPEPCWDSFAYERQPRLLPGTNFTRSGPAIATNRRGELESYSTDAVRQDYDPDTKGLLGWLINGQRQNKNTNYNAAPTDTTGLTKGGDAASILSIVDDEAELRLAGLGQLIDDGDLNGDVIKLDNTSGVAEATVNIAGTVGNTNKHSVSAYCRVDSGTGTMQIGTAEGPVTFTNTDYERIISNNITPANSSRTVSFKITAGGTLYIILNMLEQAVYASDYPVIVAGSAVVRPADNKVFDTDNTNGLIDSDDFTICVEAIAASAIAVSQFALSIENGTANEAVWIYIADSNNELRMTVRNGGTSAANITTGGVSVSGKKFRAVAAIKDSAMRFTIAIEGVDLGNGVGVARTYSSALGAVPSGIDRIVFGNRSDLTFPFDSVVARAWGYDHHLVQSDAETLIAFA